MSNHRQWLLPMSAAYENKAYDLVQLRYSVIKQNCNSIDILGRHQLASMLMCG